MAKKMRRVLALIMALTLIAGQVSLPAMADQAVQPTQTTQETVTQPDGSTVTTITDEANGTVITITESTTVETDPDTGSTTTSTDKETVTAKTDGTSTTQEQEWKDETVNTDGPTITQEGNPTTVEEGNVTTTVEGQQTTTQTVTNNGNGTETVSVKVEGEETTNIEDTTVTTTTETGVLLGDKDTEEPTKTEEIQGTDTTTGEWVEGTPTDNDWVAGQMTEGKPTTGKTTTDSTETITPTDDKGASLNMTPGGREVTKKNWIVDLADVANLPTGEEYTVKELRDAHNNLLGWEVTYEPKETTSTTPTKTENLTPNADWTETGSQTNVVKPNLNVTEDTDDSDGVTTVIEEIIDPATGEFKGYKIIKTTVTTSTDNTSAASQAIVPGTGTQDTEFHLPAKPEESTVTDPDTGATTTVTVTDLMENGVHVGYTATTVITDEEGNTLYTETKNTYGTSTTKDVDVVKTPETDETTTTTKVTTTEVEEVYATESQRVMELLQKTRESYETTIVTEGETYELVETEDGMFFLYKGQMYAVQALSGHGKLNMEQIKPTVTASTGEDLKSKTGITNPPSLSTNPSPNATQFKYVNYGLISKFYINKSNNNLTSEVHLYQLVDKNGDAYYVYCADLSTTAYRKSIYEINNVEDESYYQNNQNDDAIGHLKTIAYNGYWGTEGKDTDGTPKLGSLDHITAMLKKYDKYFTEDLTKVANSLTDGQAMTATQAAIWYFGNNGEEGRVHATNPAGNQGTEEDRRNINTLFKVLISDRLMNGTDTTASNVLDAEDITGTTLKIKNEVTDNSGNAVTDNNGNKKYNTDLTFNLSVKKSELTGNITVKVIQGGKTVKSVQLATEDSNVLGQLIAGGNEIGSSYTIQNLQLFEGVDVTLKLEGTQNLKEGVYLYTAVGGVDDSQSFIGIAEGDRDVKLQVKLNFTVEDPQIQHTTHTTTQKRTDTRVLTKTDTRIDTKDTQRNVTGGEIKTEVSHHTDTYGTVTTTETVTKTTKENRKWEAYFEYLLTTIRDEDGKKNRGEDIFDEDVPLADAPLTGDISGIWAVISGLSLGGAAMLNRKRKNEE